MGRVLVDMEYHELKFRLNIKELKLNTCQSMNQPREISVVSTIDIIDEVDIGEPIDE